MVARRRLTALLALPAALLWLGAAPPRAGDAAMPGTEGPSVSAPEPSKHLGDEPSPPPVTGAAPAAKPETSAPDQSAAPAPAEPPPPEQPKENPPTKETPPKVAPPPKNLEPLAKADTISILGKKVRGPAGEDMGRVVDLLLDRNAQPLAVVIDFGGFLGVGSRKIAIDWSLVHFTPDDRDAPIQLGLGKSDVQASPEYKDSAPQPVMVGPPPPPEPAATQSDSPEPPPPEQAPPQPDASR